VEIYHGPGVSTDETTVAYLLGPDGSQSVAVVTGDLDHDGVDEVVVLFDLRDGTSQLVIYRVTGAFGLEVSVEGDPFVGRGTDVVVLTGLE
jgi:hypothetical protein